MLELETTPFSMRRCAMQTNGHLPPKNPRKFATAYSQAKRLQALILHDAENPDLKPVIRAALARSFCELEETKRKLRMRPLPKSIDVSKPKQYAKRVAKHAPQFTQPSDDASPQEPAKESLSTPTPCPHPPPGEG